MTEKSDIYWDAMSDKGVLAILGRFIRETRLSQNKTQQELADSAGMARSTLALLENGSGGTLLSLIQALRMLDQLHLFKAFQVTNQISPLLLAKQAQSKRQRASRSEDKQGDKPTTSNENTW